MWTHLVRAHVHEVRRGTSPWFYGPEETSWRTLKHRFTKANVCELEHDMSLVCTTITRFCAFSHTETWQCEGCTFLGRWFAGDSPPPRGATFIRFKNEPNLQQKTPTKLDSLQVTQIGLSSSIAQRCLERKSVAKAREFVKTDFCCL